MPEPYWSGGTGVPSSWGLLSVEPGARSGAPIRRPDLSLRGGSAPGHAGGQVAGRPPVRRSGARPAAVTPYTALSSSRVISEPIELGGRATAARSGRRSGRRAGLTGILPLGHVPSRAPESRPLRCSRPVYGGCDAAGGLGLLLRQLAPRGGGRPRLCPASARTTASRSGLHPRTRGIAWSGGEAPGPGGPASLRRGSCASLRVASSPRPRPDGASARSIFSPIR